LPVHREMGEKVTDLRRTRFPGVSPADEMNVAFDPVEIGGLCPNRIATQAHVITQALEEGAGHALPRRIVECLGYRSESGIAQKQARIPGAAGTEAPPPPKGTCRCIRHLHYDKQCLDALTNTIH